GCTEHIESDADLIRLPISKLSASHPSRRTCLRRVRQTILGENLCPLAVRRVEVLLDASAPAIQAFQVRVGGTRSNLRVACSACTLCRNPGGNRIPDVQPQAESN